MTRTLVAASLTVLATGSFDEAGGGGVNIEDETTTTSLTTTTTTTTANDHPYDVTADAIRDASQRMEVGGTLRPCLQAFWWDSDQIRRSIQAAEDAGVGWMLWNIASNFDRAAIPTDEELENTSP